MATTLKSLRLILFFLFFPSLLLSVDGHPLKLSVTRIVLNKESSRIRISIKIFTDDFGVCLESNCQKVINFSNLTTVPKDKECLLKYVQDNFNLTLNEKKLFLKFTGLTLSGGEADNEAILLEYESLPFNIKNIKKVKIYNTLLYNNIPEQKNLIYFNSAELGNHLLEMSNESGEKEKVIFVPSKE